MKNIKVVKGYLFIIASAFIFGCMPLMAKHVYAEGVNPISLVVLRNILSMPILFSLGLLNKESCRASRKALPFVLCVGVLGCALTPLLLFTSYNYISGGVATVLHFVYPALVLVLYFLFSKEKMTKSSVISIALCIIGIAMFYDVGGSLNIEGALLALASGLTYSVYIFLLGKYGRRGMGNFIFSFYVTSGAALVLLIVALLTDSLVFPTSLLGWLLCVLFAVMINVGAVVLFQVGTFIIGGQKAAIFSTIEPITGLIVGFLAFNESVSPLSIIGSALVISASILIATSKKDTQ